MISASSWAFLIVSMTDKQSLLSSSLFWNNHRTKTESLNTEFFWKFLHCKVCEGSKTKSFQGIYLKVWPTTKGRDRLFPRLSYYISAVWLWVNVVYSVQLSKVSGSKQENSERCCLSTSCCLQFYVGNIWAALSFAFLNFTSGSATLPDPLQLPSKS